MIAGCDLGTKDYSQGETMNLFKFDDFKSRDLPAIVKLYDEEKNIRAMA